MAIWIIWLIIGTAGILCFAALVIPKIMVRMHAATLTVRAKTVDRFKNEYGDTVVYVPSASVRRYIRRYSVGRDKDGLFFKGELSRKAAFAEYELTVYDVNGGIVQILRAQEKFNETGETAVVRLPDKTDYVGVRLVCIDDDPIPAERRRFNASYALWLAALCASLAAASDLLIWLVISFILRVRDGFTMTLDLPASLWAGILGVTALVVVCFTCALCLGGFFMRKRGDLND